MRSGLLYALLLGVLPSTHGAPQGPVPRDDVSNRDHDVLQRDVNALPGDPDYTATPNGQYWYDNAGNMVDAHGGGFLKVDDWYYWVGQSKHQDFGPPYSEAHINLYKSKDLLNWDFVGAVIDVYTKDENGIQILTYCKTERPKILYNTKTKKYVLWAHWEEYQSYTPSRLFVATSDNVEGPYTVTAKGSFRPGEGNQDESAMGDRVGGLIQDFSAVPKTAGNTSYPYKAISGWDYPPRALQYAGFDIKKPNDTVYLTQSQSYGTAQRGNSWTYELTSVYFDLTVKLLSVKMTPWDLTQYNKYSPYWDIDAEDYVFRYPSKERSEVTTFKFVMGDVGNERTKLVKPDIHPGLDESASDETVLVHSGDAAFITCNTTNSVIRYTTDGSTPSSNSSQYYSGTRISVAGSVGKNLTVKAICTLDNETSPVVARKYTIVSNTTDVPIFRPFLSIPSGTYTPNDPAFGYKSVKIYCPSYNTECYYTMDGKDPNPPMLGQNIGYRARDETLWVDPKDDTGYLFVTSDNVYFRIWQLNNDYTDVLPDKEYDAYVRSPREAPALIRNGGKSGKYVYLVTSGQSGWYPNQAMFSRTTDVTAGFKAARDPITGYRNASGAWSAQTPLGNPTTWYSQPTYILDLSDNGTGPYIYVGDRWNPSELWQSTYVFLPLEVNDTGIPVTGVEGGGSINLPFMPNLEIDVAGKSLLEPEWKLLSLNKSVNATVSATLTPDQIAAGTYNYSAKNANDGVDYDLGPYDDVEQFYRPRGVPYYWQVDLEKEYNLTWIGLSFKSVGGSDAVERYTVTGSRDGSYFFPLIDNTGNLHPGYMSHYLSGSYRYIRINVYSVYDVVHNKEADWEVAMYEVSVYGTDSGAPSNTTTSTTTSANSRTATGTSGSVTTTPATP